MALEQEHRFSIDEMMIPYKGKQDDSRYQYLKNKPNKWGFKLYTLLGVSGIIYDFVIYGGDDTFRNHSIQEEEILLGFGAKVVISLCKSLKNPPGSIAYFNNFFSSFELTNYLRYEELGVFSLGNMRKDRLRA